MTVSLGCLPLQYFWPQLTSKEVPESTKHTQKSNSDRRQSQSLNTDTIFILALNPLPDTYASFPGCFLCPCVWTKIPEQSPVALWCLSLPAVFVNLSPVPGNKTPRAKFCTNGAAGCRKAWPDDVWVPGLALSRGSICISTSGSLDV